MRKKELRLNLGRSSFPITIENRAANSTDIVRRVPGMFALASNFAQIVPEGVNVNEYLSHVLANTWATYANEYLSRLRLKCQWIAEPCMNEIWTSGITGHCLEIRRSALPGMYAAGKMGRSYPVHEIYMSVCPPMLRPLLHFQKVPSIWRTAGL